MATEALCFWSTPQSPESDTGGRQCYNQRKRCLTCAGVAYPLLTHIA